MLAVSVLNQAQEMLLNALDLKFRAAQTVACFFCRSPMKRNFYFGYQKLPFPHEVCTNNPRSSQKVRITDSLTSYDPTIGHWLSLLKKTGILMAFSNLHCLISQIEKCRQ